MSALPEPPVLVDVPWRDLCARCRVMRVLDWVLPRLWWAFLGALAQVVWFAHQAGAW